MKLSTLGNNAVDGLRKKGSPGSHNLFLRREYIFESFFTSSCSFFYMA